MAKTVRYIGFKANAKDADIVDRIMEDLGLKESDAVRVALRLYKAPATAEAKLDAIRDSNDIAITTSRSRWFSKFKIISSGMMGCLVARKRQRGGICPRFASVSPRKPTLESHQATVRYEPCEAELFLAQACASPDCARGPTLQERRD